MELGSPDDLAVRVPWTRLLELTGPDCWNRQRAQPDRPRWRPGQRDGRNRCSPLVPTTVTRFQLSRLGSLKLGRLLKRPQRSKITSHLTLVVTSVRIRRRGGGVLASRLAGAAPASLFAVRCRTGQQRPPG